jgi:hypothetical protein
MNLVNKTWLCNTCVHKYSEWIEENNGLEKVYACAYYKIYFPYADKCSEYELDRDKST